MRVYLDHNGTTRLRPEVRELWADSLQKDFGNPSSTHASGRRARAAIDDARQRIASALSVPEEWVIFTSGGTEANNAALRGVLETGSAGLAIGATEHSSVRETARALSARGHELWELPVDDTGALRLDELATAAERSNCQLLSVMLANNEVGSVSDMEGIAAVLASVGKARPYWHSDCVQALGKVALDLKAWGVDLASFSAHKVGGPQGVGVLLRKPGVPFAPLLHGGGQENVARSGTENVAGIVCTALAVELAVAEQSQYSTRVGGLTAKLWEELRKLEPSVRLLGPPIDSARRLPNTLNVLFEAVDGRSLIARLDLEGLEASLGSACSSGAIEPSHVLLAMGCDEAQARAGLRLSLGRDTSSTDIHSAVETLGKVLCETRARN